MKKTVIVSGCEGFIGKNVTNFFLSNNFKVIGIDKKKKSDCKNKNFKFLKLDLKYKTLILRKLLKFKKIECLIHLAARPGIIDCNNNTSQAFEDNVISTINIFNISEKLKIKKIFYFSSLSTFNFNINPHIYALTKKFSQDIALTQNKYFNKNACCINLSNVYGDHSEKKKSFINLMVRSELKKDTLKVFNYGVQKRDFIYVEDIPKTIIFLLKKKKLPHQFNLCASKLYKLKNVLKLYQKVCKNRLKYKLLGKQKNYNETKKMKIIKNSKGIKLTNLELGLIKTRNFYIQTFKK